MVTTRFAPSPTGYIHIGNLRTALMNFLIAKKSGGTFILRIDDTDQERSKQEYIDQIQRDLEWLGLTWDKMEQQSLRMDRYLEAGENLKAQGRFYECFETAIELDLKRKKQLNMGKPPVYDRAALRLSEEEKASKRADHAGYWRFLLNQERINWHDGILGEISIDAASVSDPVLIRADGQMLYTLASVVDDMDMGITDIVRGSDHVTNTATQIQLIEALGGKAPNFAHHSLLVGAQGEALSKRIGSLSIREFREKGIEPMALLSMIARLGSSSPVVLAHSLDELAAGFELSSFGSAPTKFDPEDVERVSAAWLKQAELDEVKDALSAVPEHFQAEFWEMARENTDKRRDIETIWQMVSGEIVPIIDEDDAEFFALAQSLMPEQWTETSWKSLTEDLKTQTGRKGKSLFLPLRKAFMGQEHGPDMSKFLTLRAKIRGSL